MECRSLARSLHSLETWGRDHQFAAFSIVGCSAAASALQGQARSGGFAAQHTTRTERFASLPRSLRSQLRSARIFSVCAGDCACSRLPVAAAARLRQRCAVLLHCNTSTCARHRARTVASLRSVPPLGGAPPRAGGAVARCARCGEAASVRHHGAIFAKT